MAEAAAATSRDAAAMSSTASALGRLNLLTASEAMDTSQRNDSVSGGRGSMGAPSRGKRRWMRKQEKEEAKRVKIEEDERVSGVSSS